MRGNHEKAVVYFQRALRLNPQYTSAYTLMGHEFMETKNTSAAIEAYRKAIGMYVMNNPQIITNSLSGFRLSVEKVGHDLGMLFTACD